MNSVKTRKALFKLLIFVILANVVLLFSGAAISLWFQFSEKQLIVELLVKTNRKDFLIADHRNAILGLNPSINSHFESIKYSDRKAEHVFTLGRSPSHFFVKEICRPIFINSGTSKKKFGTLIFEYSYFSQLLSTLTILALIILASIPLYLRLARTVIRVSEVEFKEQEAQLRESVAKQVSHDIRSPISTLNMVVGTATSLSVEQRRLMQLAADRINDIANNLLKKESREGPQAQIVSVIDLVMDIVAEKEIEFKNHHIVFEVNANHSQKVYSKLTSSDLKRTLSNIINNSVEASSTNVSISISILNDWIDITIRDNGTGFPKHVLAKLGKMGVSYGKPGGTGLGIAHAVETIKNINGEIRFANKNDRGSEVQILLRRI